MKIETITKNKAMCIFQINLDKDEFDAEINKAYEKNKDKYSIAGFRKGKVPRAVIEKNYGSDVFFEDAINGVATAQYGKYLTENKLTPFTYPEISVKKLDDTGLEMTIEIPFAPSVELGEYKGLNIKKLVYTITDEEVNQELKREQEKLARFEETKQPAKLGDMVNLDFKGFVKGKAFEGGESKGFDLELGSNSFVPGFEDSLVGVKQGEEKVIEVVFPKDYHAKNLAGKPTVFKCKINAVKVKMLPVLDDEFAKNASEWNTLEEFKKSIKASLKIAKDKNKKAELEQKVVEAIIDKSKFEFSDLVVKEEYAYIMNQLETNLAPMNIDVETYCKYSGISLEALKDAKLKEAEKIVKMRLVLSEIMAKEKIEVSEDEIIAKVIENIPSAKLTAESAKKYYEKLSNERKEAIKNEAIMQKLLSFLVENNVK